MHLSVLCALAHLQAIKKGFWGKKGKKKRNISELLMLIVSELGEACEALRTGKRQEEAIYGYKKGQLIKDTKLTRMWQKDTFEDELADVFIRLADLCKALNINIEWQIKQKLNYNETRPKKHGKKF
jgi:NTP pyrophosphatase (non-canonical NTP hydrolase)